MNTRLMHRLPAWADFAPSMLHLAAWLGAFFCTTAVAQNVQRCMSITKSTEIADVMAYLATPSTSDSRK